MATFNKFNDFSEQVLRATHNFGSHVFKWYLSNTAPVATNSVKADIAEISAGNGYTAGGGTTTITLSRTGGTTTVFGTDVVTTATGPVGPFRYAVLYNSTSASSNLVGWVDYGVSQSLANTETFTVDCNPTTGIFDLV